QRRDFADQMRSSLRCGQTGKLGQHGALDLAAERAATQVEARDPAVLPVERRQDKANQSVVAKAVAQVDQKGDPPWIADRPAQFGDGGPPSRDVELVGPARKFD